MAMFLVDVEYFCPPGIVVWHQISYHETPLTRRHRLLSDRGPTHFLENPCLYHPTRLATYSDTRDSWIGVNTSEVIY